MARESILGTPDSVAASREAAQARRQARDQSFGTDHRTGQASLVPPAGMINGRYL